MQCDQYREQLELIANDSAEKKDFPELHQHLNECTACRQNLAYLRKLDSLIQQQMNNIISPPYLAAQVSARIEIKARKSTPLNKLIYPLVHPEDDKKYLDIDKSI
jgi:predicted anti-sigma-YlaC factor YlaD